MVFPQLEQVIQDAILFPTQLEESISLSEMGPIQTTVHGTFGKSIDNLKNLLVRRYKELDSESLVFLCKTGTSISFTTDSVIKNSSFDSNQMKEAELLGIVKNRNLLVIFEMVSDAEKLKEDLMSFLNTLFKCKSGEYRVKNPNMCRVVYLNGNEPVSVKDWGKEVGKCVGQKTAVLDEKRRDNPIDILEDMLHTSSAS